MNLHVSPDVFDYIISPLVLTMLAVFARFAWRLAVRETNRVENVEHMHVEAPHVEPARPSSDSEALAALGLALGKSEERLDHVEEKLGNALTLLDKALKRIDSLEHNEGHLIAWIHTLHKGIEDGTIPPMLTIPTHIRALLGI